MLFLERDRTRLVDCHRLATESFQSLVVQLVSSDDNCSQLLPSPKIPAIDSIGLGLLG